MNVTLGPEHGKLIQAKIASGQYESAEAVIAEALRLLHVRDRTSQGMEHPKLKETLGLYALGVDMMVQNLQRAFPEASQKEINRRLRAWLDADDVSDHTPAYFRVAPERLEQLVR